jgi:hypothetical protein
VWNYQNTKCEITKIPSHATNWRGSYCSCAPSSQEPQDPPPVKHSTTSTFRSSWYLRRSLQAQCQIWFSNHNILKTFHHFTFLVCQMSNSTRGSSCVSPLMRWLLKSSFDQNSIMINYKHNDDFKSHINRKDTRGKQYNWNCNFSYHYSATKEYLKVPQIRYI